METVLNLAIWLPLASAVIIAILPASQERNARWIAAIASALALLLAAGVAFDFASRLPSSGSGPQFVTHVPWIRQLGVSYFVGLDGLSLPMFVLNAFLIFLAVLISWNTALRPKEYFALVMVLETAVAGVFAGFALLAVAAWHAKEPQE